jgi:hypothetical protein
MKPSVPYRLMSVVFLLAISGLTDINAQRARETGHYVVGPEIYDQVLDSLFPRPQQPVGGYAFVLRYMPSLGPESQITIVARQGQFEVTEYTSVDGSIEAQLNRIYRRMPYANARMMAKRIKVVKRIIDVTPEEARKWRDSFYHSGSVTFNDDRLYYQGKPTTLILDGTRYELWYAGLVKINYDSVASGIDSRGAADEESFTVWMKTVYTRVQALKRRK